jgi:high-affinity Fe2+/Pb2+ permease
MGDFIYVSKEERDRILHAMKVRFILGMLLALALGIFFGNSNLGPVQNVGELGFFVFFLLATVLLGAVTALHDRQRSGQFGNLLTDHLAIYSWLYTEERCWWARPIQVINRK